MKTQKTLYLDQAREVLSIEASALTELAAQLDEHFVQAIDIIIACRGRVVVIGMGKSGHIGRKIAATLASTGTPAFFVHPAEAAHGDLGMIIDCDVVLALSYSGESEEVINLLPALKRKGISIIAITGRPQSTLAKNADIHLDITIQREACPMGLAPTASTTAALALGDALAVVLLQARQFTPEDFALSHPAGALGKKLLVHVSDLMHADDSLPAVQSGSMLKEALIVMSEKGLGLTAVVDHQNQLLGIFTDGDLRRLFNHTDNLSEITIDQVMGTTPQTIEAEKLASEALYIMQQKKINALLVVDQNNKLIGALNMHDLLKAGIV